MKIKYFFISLIVTVPLLFLSCDSEDNIIPTPIDTMSRFEFPEGNDEWDKAFENLYENHGCQMIYKKFDMNDLKKSWTVDGFISGDPQFEHYENEEELNNIHKIFEEKIFKYLNPELSKKVFPPYIYLAKNYKAPFFGMYWSPLAFDTGGMDAWVVSFDESLTLPSSGKQPTIINKYVPGWIIAQYFKVAAINRSLINIPQKFIVETDYETKIDFYTETADNFYKKRGICHRMNFQSQRVFGTPNDKEFGENPIKYDFWNFIVMLTVDLDFETTYTDYPLVVKKANLVLNYMKDEYNIDLQEIARQSPYNE